MASSIPVSASIEASAPMKREVPVSPLMDLFRRFRQHKLAVASVCVLVLLVLGVTIGPWFWPLDISDIDLTASMHPPSWQHPFGTDDLGQDLLARMMYGGRISLAVGVTAMLVSTLLGTVVGAISGMSRGRLGPFLMWVTDVFLSLPQLPLLLLILYFFREDLKQMFGVEGGVFVLVVTVIGGLRWMPIARLVRAQFLSLREKEFVEAARTVGATRWRLIWHHILPNAIGPVIVAGTIEVSVAIIAESTLSFLGLGFPPDVPTWGRLLFDAKDYLNIAPYAAMVPGVAIFLTVLSINFIGDGLRDTFDPRRVF